MTLATQPQPTPIAANGPIILSVDFDASPTHVAQQHTSRVRCKIRRELDPKKNGELPQLVCTGRETLEDRISFTYRAALKVTGSAVISNVSQTFQVRFEGTVPWDGHNPQVLAEQLALEEFSRQEHRHKAEQKYQERIIEQITAAQQASALERAALKILSKGMRLMADIARGTATQAIGQELGSRVETAQVTMAVGRLIKGGALTIVTTPTGPAVRATGCKAWRK